MTFENNQFSVIIAVGPSEMELPRVAQIAENLQRHESRHLHRLVIVNDGGVGSRFDALQSQYAFVEVLPSFRNGLGDGWRGGLTANVFGAFVHAFQHSKVSFVLKVDTDSYILRPFSQRILEFFEKNGRVGLCGSCYEFDLNGNRVADSTWRVNLKKHGQILRFRRNPYPRIEHSLYGERKRFRVVLHAAQQNGWVVGSCANGGGYAVRREMFESFMRMFSDVSFQTWLNTELTEDVIMSMNCLATGFAVKDFNRPKEPFAVVYQGMPCAMEILANSNYAIIHSLKCGDPKAEEQLRDALRQISLRG